MDETRMLRSVDSGQTWEMITVDPEYSYIQVVGFIDSLRGWTGGDETLYQTTDGGETWEKIMLGSTYNRFFKVNEELAYMTGRKVYKFTRELDVDIPIPPVGVDPNHHDPIHSVAVTPNPTYGKAGVHITFGNPTMAHVYLYDVNGKNMKKIFDARVDAGEKTIPIDISDPAAHVYIVILKTNEGLIRTKVVKK